MQILKFSLNKPITLSQGKPQGKKIMGMAASQARFLGLTARKSNTEYQGQQVNQQRSSLANESAGLFNMISALKVPLPPSSIDYYSSRYQFSDATKDNNFSILKMANVTKIDDTTATANLDIAYTKKTNVSSPSDISNPAITKSGGAYTAITMVVGSESKKFTLAPLDKTQNKDYVDSIQNNRADNYYTNGRTKEAETFYTITVSTGDTRIISKYDLDSVSTGPDTSVQTVDKVTAFQKKTNSESATYSATAKLVLDPTTGRYTSVTFEKGEEAIPAELANFASKAQELSIGKVDDKDGFDNAMKQYEYDKMIYERKLDELNNKTETIQQQDKGLELKLRQLDTEQKAIQTEMEAVQKVIQKNVETTFKTFG